jgi:hypothetical protein
VILTTSCTKYKSWESLGNAVRDCGDNISRSCDLVNSNDCDREKSYSEKTGRSPNEPISESSRQAQKGRPTVLTMTGLSDVSRHAAHMGVSMMVMGHHLREIHAESMRPYLEAIDREERRKKVLAASEKWTEIWSLLFVTVVFAVLPVLCLLIKIFWCCGAAIFSTTEGWTYFDGLYFCMVFFLTIGYVTSTAD